MLIVDKHCSDICCDEIPLPQIDRKNKQLREQWHILFAINMGKIRYFKQTPKISKIVDE